MATNPLQFIQQVQAEVSKVVWPTRREVALTTAMVFCLGGDYGDFLLFRGLDHPNRPSIRFDQFRINRPKALEIVRTRL